VSNLSKLLDRISAPAGTAGAEAQQALDRLTKPPGSLGRLEGLARRLAEISGHFPPRAERAVIFTLAADHGVVVEGVSAYPQIVTAQMVENLLRGGAAVNVLARHAGARVAAVTGTGTGVDEEGRGRKVAAIERALAVNRPDADDGIDVLAKVGGFEIAGLCGVILAGAASRIPVVLDGFIAGAAALAAVRIKREARHYLLASHRSTEPGAGHVLDALGLEPYLDLRMRLGEGTGAALCIGLAKAAVKILGEMATFKSAGVTDRSP
jgi:NaMN:DMB phosphoribosyltransferase